MTQDPRPKGHGYAHESKWEKIKRKITTIITDKIEGTFLQFRWYRSYWHYKIYRKNAGQRYNTELPVQYLSQKPNYGAGIGHQLANWNTGFYFADFYHLQFVHFQFSSEKWEYFLGFGENEIKAASLLKDRRIKKIYLPRFDNTNEKHLELIRNIIHSYRNKKVFFLLAHDQAYMKQFETAEKLSEKFFQASARKDNKFIYPANGFNIAIHIRRGDIEVHKERWLDNAYYVNVLAHALETIATDKNINVYLFSQGTKADFPEFSVFSNIYYCLDMTPYDSFLHMIYADILISSKSAFSYKPALWSKGIKICPATFWHSYPASSDFVLADDNGNFDGQKLKTAIASENLLPDFI